MGKSSYKSVYLTALGLLCFTLGCGDAGRAAAKQCVEKYCQPGIHCVGSCSRDTDDDGIVDAQDNCPHAANHSQTDRDADGLGDKCDPQPNTKTFTLAGQSVGRQPSQSEHSAVTMRNGQFVMTGELSR